MSTYIDAARWFKQSFGPRIEPELAGTPFTVDLLAAIAIQETFEVWGRIYKTIGDPDDVLPLCVGDVIGEPKRTAFPRTKAELLAAPDGAAMFDVAHQALVDMASHVPAYQVYANNPERFCHAFGIFQYDIQFFRDDPDFFLQKQWGDFDECLRRCIAELKRVLVKTFGPSKTSLNDIESVYVAIGYNSGHVKITDGLKQGFKDDTGKYYGEYVNDYLQAARAAVVA
jgi:hypothetical protein